MKIVISGGHLTPALALIDYIQAHHAQDEIVFVGRLYSQEKSQKIAPEKQEIEQRAIKFIPLVATKTQHNKLSWRKLPNQWRFFQSIGASLQVIKQEQPDVFVSFGGYLAVPLAIAAKLFRVKIITHEQTYVAGFANQIIAFVADKIALAHSSSRPYFPTKKTVVVGNPIRPELLQKSSPKPSWVKHKLTKPVLLIAGGSQGSRMINQTIVQLLPTLTKSWSVIHLCGSSSSQINHKEHFQQLAADQLTPAQQKRYYPQEWVSGHEMAWIYNQTKMAISRAGANAVAELTLKRIPTIFIPLPFAHHNEQLKNAQKLAAKQAGLILPQDQLSPTELMDKINQLKQNYQQIKHNLSQISLESNASHQLYQLLRQLHED